MNDTLNRGELYCDTRIGGIKRWYIGKPKDADMRVPDDVLDSVCFICVLTKEGGVEKEYFIGTGFFVGLPTSIQGKRFTYLVTAAHVIQGAKDAGYSEIYIRLNTYNGQSITAFIQDGWHYPENPAADVAVLPISINFPYVKYRTMPLEGAITPAILEHEQIGIGDELFIVGLFNQRSGERRNIPIVRTGIIASMPDEPFEDEDGNAYDAYLVEMRSIGGLSGSPVFVFLDAWRSIPDTPQFDINNLRWRIFLLGVIRGHWNLEREEIESDNIGLAQINDEIDRLHTGIAQVTPIQEVFDIINKEELVKEREEIEKQARKKQQPTLDSNLPAQAERAEITPDAFEEALRRASRKISPPDEEKNKT